MIRVQDRQCLIDIALATTGSVEGVVSLASLNGLNPTQPLRLGRQIRSQEVIDSNVIQRYDARGIVPATEHNDESFPNS